MDQTLYIHTTPHPHVHVHVHIWTERVVGSQTSIGALTTQPMLRLWKIHLDIGMISRFGLDFSITNVQYDIQGVFFYWSRPKKF